MNFISMEFLIFFPLVLLICGKLPNRAGRSFLLAVSYLFYMDGISWIGLLLFVSTGISWLAARQIERTSQKAVKKAWLAAVLMYCLGCLVLFKQEDFLVPGISFYMFQALSYVLDVYGKKSESEPCFGCYALYVSFFPQLVAGPIERAGSLLPQLKKTVTITGHNLSDGFFLMMRGFFKKLAVADYLAAFVGIVYDAPEQAGGLAAVIATLFFAVQIYCDFSGYTDIARGAARMLGIELMENFDHPYQAENIQEFWRRDFSGYTDIARGAARMLGIELMENFDHPYQAENIQEFWRRWHISLTKWMTDYLYIPLGGSKKGFLRTCRNRMIVFAVSGLWHGLSWHYAVWGLLHGSFLTVWQILNRFRTRHNACSRQNSRPFRLLHGYLARFMTFAAVCFAWIFFRADSLSDAWVLIRRIFFHFMEVPPVRLLHFFQMPVVSLFRLFLVLFCLFMLEKLPDASDGIRQEKQAAVTAFFAFCIVTVSVLSWLDGLAENGGNSFIYFSF